MPEKLSKPLSQLSKAGRPKSETKGQRILSSASSLFLSQGFSSTSMDAVANLAGVSKQTVYSHFTNKEHLFTAVIEKKLRDYQFDADFLAESQQLGTLLNKTALSLIELYLDEQVVAMYRVVIGEITRAPQVPELFYNAGIKHTTDLLLTYLRPQVPPRHSDNAIKEQLIHFLNMLKGEYHMKSILGLEYNISQEQKNRLASQAVEQLMRNLELRPNQE